MTTTVAPSSRQVPRREAAARVDRLVVGAPDLKAGAVGSLYNLCADPRLNHEVAVTVGVLEEECAALLTRFFEARR